jgi:uncharacterized protein YdaU (DUF1376 family)
MKGEFYKMEFDAWDEGTVELTLEEEAAYLRLCHQMYRRHGPIPNSDRLLCSLWRCHQNKARPLLQRLIEKGKIFVTEDQRLANTRTIREVDTRETLGRRRAHAGHTGGIRSGDVRRKSLNGHDTHEAIASSKIPTKEEIREEKIEDTYVSLSETSSDARLPRRDFGEKIPTSSQAEPSEMPARCESLTADGPGKREPDPVSPPPKKRKAYPADFETFWQSYPTDALMSKKLAFEAWQRLDEDARTEVMASLPAFGAYCASKPDYRPVHAVRYITQHRSEGFVQLAAKAADRVFVPKDTPEWEAWQRVKRVQPVMSTEHHKEGWWFPSRWPEQQQEAAA